jgi:TolB-like protein
MKKILILISAISLTFSQEYIAVIDFEGINVSEAEAKALSQNLTSEIIALDKYTVVERSAMKRIMDEQKFQHSGCVDTQCAVDIGKILGAKYIIVGSVGKVGKTFSIDARMIEVETGESYQSANYKHKGEIDDLLIEGMKSVAYQLAGMEYESKGLPTISKNNSTIILKVEKYNSTQKHRINIIERHHFKIYKIVNDDKFYIGKTQNKDGLAITFNKSFQIDNEPNMSILIELFLQNAFPLIPFRNRPEVIGTLTLDNFETGLYEVKNTKDILKGKLKIEFN